MTNVEDHQITEEHVHGENCNHDNDHGHGEAHVEEESHKKAKGERKFTKIMKKQGLTVVPGITRVTMRTNKNFIMYIDNPVVMNSGKGNNSFVIYGEPKFLDFKNNVAEEQAQKFTKSETTKEKPEEKLGDIKEDEEEGNDEDVDQGDLKDEDIENLISYSNCSRAKAIKALKQSNGDIVEAITLLT
jgi:nascent polypeptide-associated complex subunit alpha